MRPSGEGLPEPRRRLDRAPLLQAAGYVGPGTGEPGKMITPRQRQQLLALSTRMTIPRGRVIYREQAAASAIFFIREGAVKTYRELPSGTRRVTMFLFSDDLFGLAEDERYVNTAEAITTTTCYRIPRQELSQLLQQDASLEYQFLIKLTQIIREGQRRVIMMGRRDAAGRLAMFLTMMRKQQKKKATRESIPLPMSRSDIAAFIGHSLEAVSRATTELKTQGIIAFQGAHLVRVLDPVRLDRLASDV